ncbi:hypothetical protein SY2F82_50940 [Streptomyces sp. Y2F8-2]|nr:hypothetical protein SY2F82_50940 [Streptomyces sp. Y2F8-2]
MARDPGRPGVRAQQGGQQPDGRGLARAVGAEQPADRALRHREIQPTDGMDLTEAFLQPLTKYSVRSSHGSTIAHYVRCT